MNVCTLFAVVGPTLLLSPSTASAFVSIQAQLWALWVLNLLESQELR
jgi:hypothetical protein